MALSGYYSFGVPTSGSCRVRAARCGVKAIRPWQGGEGRCGAESTQIIADLRVMEVRCGSWRPSAAPRRVNIRAFIESLLLLLVVALRCAALSRPTASDSEIVS